MMTVVTPINPDWQLLREEITTQARAACQKLETALERRTSAPPLDLGEALEDAANEYLNLADTISRMYRPGLYVIGAPEL